MPVITVLGTGDRKNMSVRLAWTTGSHSVLVNENQPSINSKRVSRERKDGKLRKRGREEGGREADVWKVEVGEKKAYCGLEAREMGHKPWKALKKQL